ncbi:hypothetical protein CC85DRAFT_284795 [Cutaneotrichosporon oleaginosum]|uniref:Mis12-domain-containing protein n=1 Tax=Cutaneotrichosporon oleaginosum TaxID=879819 RepID=A0A0J0XQ63_9TREE|nr:uncharacterized protein CC85DRAFT_284795 [Cutaneotrichosporon oleaginosum]KLT43238.1 hypothetical protein CC85DRAFT_284795 [Cutaneotrichosporon oleaginosum]TXT09918.1 hypothetical protein COLE_03852 [Cutaneotrichosporon oleaginosum]
MSRKSLSHASHLPTKSAPSPSPPAASSSKHTLDMPPLDLPDSITWDYEPAPRAPATLSKDDKEAFMAELMGFEPYHVLSDIAEHARQAIYPTVSSVEGWARSIAANRAAHDAEVDRGSHAFETLLENVIDRAFDKYTAYALRNAFGVPDGVQLVLPWQKGRDFARAEFVAEMLGGEDVLAARLEALRSKVEQARLVRHRLEMAEAVLDRRLQVAEHRRKEVGFVRDAVVDAGLAPLDEKAGDVVDALSTLHSNLEDVKMQPRAPGVPPGVAWETGRQAYLSWAVGKALASGREEVSADRLDAIERQTAEIGTEADLEQLSAAARRK